MNSETKIMENDKNIELRSEKVRNVIGDIPSFIVRAGSGVIALIVIGLFLSIAFIPYPESISVDLVVDSVNCQDVYAHIMIPYRYINEINIETEAKIELEGFSVSHANYLSGSVVSINEKIISSGKDNYFIAFLLIENPTIQIQPNMKGVGYLMISNKTILKRLTNL